MKKSRVASVLILVMVMLIATLAACSADVSYKVNFEVDGTQFTSISTSGKEAISLPTAPTKEGFAFDGWYFDKDVWEQPLTINSFSDKKLTSDTTVYAKWKIDSYIITFETSGGSTIPSQTIKYNSLANQPTAPTKTGFSFAGWYKEASFATQFNFASDKITADTTIYAKWLEIFDATFNTDGGSVVDTQKVVDGKFASVPAINPTKTDFIFVGWFKEASFATQFNFVSDIITADTIIYAKWVSVDECFTFTFMDSTNSAYSLAKKSGAILPEIIVLPAEYNGKPVVAINEAAFAPCSSLTSVTIPASVTSIGLGAFGDCSSLTSIIVDSGNTKYKSIDGNLYSKDGATLLQYAVGKKETSFIIPVGVTTIDGFAFYKCSSLTSVSLPASATSIGYCPFGDCSSLTNIAVDSGNANYKSIDGNLYSKDGATLLQYAVGKKETIFIIPANVTTIGGYAFFGCSSLTSVSIPASVKIIDLCAFAGCISLTSVTIPASVTFIGSSAFDGCGGLTINAEAASQPVGWNSWWKPSNCQVNWGYNNIKTNADYDYVINNNEVYLTKYKGSALNVVIPATIEGKEVVSFGEIFKDNTTIKSLQIPASVTAIGSSAFYGCTSLASVTFEAGSKLTSIGNDAFRGCTSLTNITIPASVTSIGLAAFCCVEITADGKIVPSKLTNITVDSGNKNYKSIDGNLYSKDGSTLLQYAVGKTATSFIIPASVTIIDGSAFYGSGSLTSVTFEAGSKLTTIGHSAFSGCTSLTSITISAGVTFIGWYAFSGCNSLTIYAEAPSKPADWHYNWNPSNCPVVWDSANNIIASDGNIYAMLGGIRYALKDGNATVIKQSSTITTANIPVAVTFNNVTYIVKTIEGSAFENCSSLTSVTFKAGSELTTIGNYAFSGCTSLTSVTFEAGSKLTTIGERAFYGCSGLTNITIPAGVTAIGNFAFYGCTSLTSVTFEAESKLLSIGNDAFRGCTALTSITIPASVTAISDYACFGCTSLTSVSIPASVTSIGEYAFRGCSSLTSVAVDIGNTKYKSIDGNLYSKDGATLIQYAVGKTETSVTIPASVTTISNFAFYGCSSLTSVTFEAESKLTSIKGNAFENCNKLTSIAIPASVTTIGERAFYGCTALTKITIPAGVTTISGYAFYNCTALISVTFGAGSRLTTIDHYAFYKCSSLTSLTIPAGVKSIGDYACFGCSSLTSVTIPISVKTIGHQVISDCSGLTIYAEVEEINKPAGWASDWNPSNRPVVWGHKI